MDDTLNYNSIYIDILNRIQKKFSTYEGLLIMKKKYYTNNGFYFFLSLIFRFIHIISFCGDFHRINNKIENDTSIKQYLNYLTLHYLIKQFKISHLIYCIINLLILVLFLVRLLYLIIMVVQLNKNKNSENWIFPNKYLIIIDHIIFYL